VTRALAGVLAAAALAAGSAAAERARAAPLLPPGHRRVRMALYNEGERANGPFRLSRYPRARAELRRVLASPRYLAYAPEWRPNR
jgi:hypothetical protein